MSAQESLPESDLLLPEEMASDEYGGQLTEHASTFYRRVAETNAVDGTKQYLRGIGQTALLKADEEVLLAKQIEVGVLARQILRVRNGEGSVIREEMLRDLSSVNGKAKVSKEDQERVTLERMGELCMVAGRTGATDEELLVLSDMGDAAIERMVSANLRLVVSVAKRYKWVKLQAEDMIQEGNLGVIHAVKKFDYAKGYKFSTYATWWIKQAIIRANADKGRTVRLPVHLQDDAYAITKVRRVLLDELGRTPTDSEVATKMGLTSERVGFIRNVSKETISLAQPLGDEDRTLADLIITDDEHWAEKVAFNGVMNDQLAEMLRAQLSEREYSVISMRYGLNGRQPMTLEQVGAIRGVTRERIRQIEKQAMAKLRSPEAKDALRDYL